MLEVNNVESNLVKSLNLKYEPVAVFLSNEKPEGPSKEKKASAVVPFHYLLLQPKGKEQFLTVKL